MTRDSQEINLARRTLLKAACFGAAFGVADAWAQVPGNNSNLRQPVFRVAKKVDPGKPGVTHPLDPALKMAEDGLMRSRKTIRDYTAILVKRERVNGKVGNVEQMEIKVRNEKVVNSRVVTPFAVYLKFRSPASIKNREVLFVKGKNNGKLLAKEGGKLGSVLPSVWLKPDGSLAMRGQLYPLTDIGIENLLAKLIERGTREKKAGGCDVKFHKGFKVNNRQCTLLELKHPVKQPQFEFSLAQIFIDDDYGLPIRYAAYDWPKRQGVRPEVMEEYTYLNLKLNVGLKDVDFSKDNPKYKF